MEEVERNGDSFGAKIHSILQYGTKRYIIYIHCVSRVRVSTKLGMSISVRTFARIRQQDHSEHDPKTRRPKNLGTLVQCWCLPVSTVRARVFV